MIPRITITRTWSDNDVAQLTFEVCDGVSVFTNEAYAALDWGAAAAAALRTFGEQIHGGLFDLEAGKEGLEARRSCNASLFRMTPNTMRTFPITDNGGTVFAFEIPAQFLGLRLARRLRDVSGVSDVRPRKWRVGSADVHIRFRYHDREYIVWEPYGDNSRWWIGPDDENAPHIPLDQLERAISRS
jgi:hypothetical protein